MRTLLSILVLSILAGAECKPVSLPLGQGVDHACRVFRYVKEDGRKFIEVLKKDGQWKRTEEIDCTKARRDDFGSYSYFPKSIEGAIYCGSSK